MHKEIIVSVIIPTYNEEKFIDKCLLSLFNQTYPNDYMEWIFIDGGSTDSTLKKISLYAGRANIQIYNNEKKVVTYALNIGIRHSSGQYLIRIDAHAEYDRDYIEKCVFYLENIKADNVGGVIRTKGTGFVGETIAEILSSKFGVGNSPFRTNALSGYVDTVPFGAYKKEIFKKIGMFNPELPRSEDNDFNSRIRENGGKIYMATDIKATYYCRNTISELIIQALKNGNALFLTLRKNPKAMCLRHFIPFTFVLSLIIIPVFTMLAKPFIYLFIFEIALYLVIDLYFSLFIGQVKHSILKIFMYPLFHICYGIGSLLGLFGIKLY